MIESRVFVQCRRVGIVEEEKREERQDLHTPAIVLEGLSGEVELEVRAEY